MRMKPILIVLVLAASIMMAWTFSLGWRLHYGKLMITEGLVTDQAEAETINELIIPHFIWAMITGIAVSFVHSIVLTYFLGTGKAIKEQMEINHWDQKEYLEWRGLMAKAVIPAAIGIVMIAVAAFSGGFAMMTTISPDAHLIISGLGVFGQIPIFLREIQIVMLNGKLMDRVLDRMGEKDIRLTL